MKRGLWVGVGLLVVIPLLCLLCCEVTLTLLASEIEKSENPPATLRESDLVGTWEVVYGSQRTDRLILRADGMFKQIYQDQTRGDYAYKTPWNEWWMERFPDGRVRVHLEGARYYLAGIEEGELDGWEPTIAPGQYDIWEDRGGPPPYSFFDPFAEEQVDMGVEMVGKLVLNVRRLPSGELVLAHMWGSPDWGFGDKTQVFHRVETPSLLQTSAP